MRANGQTGLSDRRCEAKDKKLFRNRSVIVASNRGPVKIIHEDDGSIQFVRGGGGLVTALAGLADQLNISWIAAADSLEDAAWESGIVPMETGSEMKVKFISPADDAFDRYYNVISNPLLWFLQHTMWDFPRAPTIDHETWLAWDKGYVTVNQCFGEAIAAEIESCQGKPLVLLQDYQLYLAPKYIRDTVSKEKKYTLTHFVHIPWPGPEDWRMLPERMRSAILEGLLSVDMIGFQTRGDALNFIRTCESFLHESKVKFNKGSVVYNGKITYIRDFPISINVDALRDIAESSEVAQYRASFEDRFGEYRLIVRVDRTEPSKNIVRGFQAFDEMLTLHPEHLGKVMFLALLVPSRMEVHEYQDYLDELMAAAGRVNVKHGTSEWEPVRVLVGENYQRGVAALQIYDVLLVNSIIDGMNLVAKEGPTVNRRYGVLILSETTGAHQQLNEGATVISPCDVYGTAQALHEALNMPEEERKERAKILVDTIEREDIERWLCWQLEAVAALKL